LAVEMLPGSRAIRGDSQHGFANRVPATARQLCTINGHPHRVRHFFARIVGERRGEKFLQIPAGFGPSRARRESRATGREWLLQTDLVRGDRFTSREC
jgi:hypothetical protein